MGGSASRSIAINNRAIRIFPSLINETAFACRLIFDVAVAIEIAELIDPAQSCFDVRTQLIEDTQITGPRRMTAHEDQPQGCRIDRAIVRRVRNLVEVRHLSDAQFVEDFARLLIAPFVSLCSLVIGEQPDRLFGNFGVVGEHLKRGDDAIASEKRGIPGHASGIVIRRSQMAP